MGDKRITVTVPRKELEKASEHSAGTTAAVVRSLKLANAIDDYLSKGAKIIARNTDGSLVELQFV